MIPEPRVTKTAQQLLAEFDYKERFGNLWVWRVFYVRLYNDGSWKSWSTEGDKPRTGKSTTTLKRYLELMHT